MQFKRALQADRWRNKSAVTACGCTTLHAAVYAVQKAPRSPSDPNSSQKVSIGAAIAAHAALPEVSTDEAEGSNTRHTLSIKRRDEGAGARD